MIDFAFFWFIISSTLFDLFSVIGCSISKLRKVIGKSLYSESIIFFKNNSSCSSVYILPCSLIFTNIMSLHFPSWKNLSQNLIASFEEYSSSPNNISAFSNLSSSTIRNEPIDLRINGWQRYNKIKTRIINRILNLSFNLLTFFSFMKKVFIVLLGLIC
jgi:hypothetical protein